MGVVTALKNDDLEENVYMSVLEGLSSDATRNKIWKLRKSLYGLKQALHQWYVKMHNFLINWLNFETSPKYACL